jgi:hypothetical protein
LAAALPAGLLLLLLLVVDDGLFAVGLAVACDLFVARDLMVGNGGGFEAAELAPLLP